MTKLRNGWRKRRRNERSQQAADRQEKRDARSAEEQLEILDKRLGKNKGAKKERARLEKIIRTQKSRKKKKKVAKTKTKS